MMTVQSTILAKPSYIRRVGIYLNEMFPPVKHLISSAMMYLSFVSLLAIVLGLKVNLLSTYTVIGCLNIFLIALILRLMDELKDDQIDKELFPHRPLPSGRVRKRDIVLTLIVCCKIYIGIQLFHSATAVAGSLVLIYTFLMFKYFFIPERFHHLLLVNLFTHNPVMILILVLSVAVLSIQLNVAFFSLFNSITVVLILQYWLLLFGWEISRKIRYPKEETEYITYSKILGSRASTLILWGIIAVIYTIATQMYVSFSLSLCYLSIITIGFIYTSVQIIRFLRGNLSNGLSLKKGMELFIQAVLISGIIEHFIIGG